ncbi:MAG TPA: S-adenosylmethionine:tRNA ribosyltransferase-isomerase, partial [Bacillota bacterium]|nr:S-adenosylmethionine:tRNA ribosyltransferase-isomerase [Bacillota bacterium]
MLVNEFDYFLPEQQIAQQPVEPRDHSRLLVLDRKRQNRNDHHFYDIGKFLNPGDLLVFNDTRVIPARLFARKSGETGAKVEVFLLKQLNATDWECLVRPGKRIKPGTQLFFNEAITGEAVEITESGSRIIRFPGDLDFREWLQHNGETPLPPY